MWNSNKITEQTKQKQTHKYRDQTNGCQIGGFVEMDEKDKDIKKYKLVVTK